MTTSPPEDGGVGPRAIADAIGRHELGIGVNGDKGSLVADARLIGLWHHVALLFADVGPDFIGLNASTGVLAHLLVHDFGAARPDLDQQPPLFDKVTFDDLAAALGVSEATIQQARLGKEALARRSPSEGWEKAAVRLAENQAQHYRALADRLKAGKSET